MLLDTKIPVKFLYQKVRKELIFATIYVSVVAIMHEFIDMPKIPVAVPGLLGTGIAIMLGFRSTGMNSGIAIKANMSIPE